MKYIDAEKLKAEIERRRLQNRYIDTDGYEQELFEIIASLPEETVTDCHELEEAAEEYSKKATNGHCYRDLIAGFIAGAKWQREQLRDLCYQCEKDYDNVFYRGEKHAIKMLKEEAVAGEIMKSYSGALVAKTIHCIDEGKFKLGDKVKVIILKDE